MVSENPPLMMNIGIQTVGTEGLDYVSSVKCLSPHVPIFLRWEIVFISPPLFPLTLFSTWI
jgi:hypothetical protein